VLIYILWLNLNENSRFGLAYIWSHRNVFE